jgi:hypothetical protein
MQSMSASDHFFLCLCMFCSDLWFSTFTWFKNNRYLKHLGKISLKQRFFFKRKWKEDVKQQVNNITCHNINHKSLQNIHKHKKKWSEADMDCILDEITYRCLLQYNVKCWCFLQHIWFMLWQVILLTCCLTSSFHFLLKKNLCFNDILPRCLRYLLFLNQVNVDFFFYIQSNLY